MTLKLSSIIYRLYVDKFNHVCLFRLGIDDDFYDSDSDGSDSGGHSSQD